MKFAPSVLAACVLCAPLLAGAQSVADPCPASRQPGSVTQPDSARSVAPTSPPSNPAIALFASVAAREVTFRTEPRIAVRLCWGGDTLRVLERRNIPAPVRAGTTYRNVYVAVEILARFDTTAVNLIQGTEP